MSVGAGTERRIFEWRASPVYDRYGRAGGRIVLLRDMTEQRRSAEERQQLIAMVEHSDDLIGMADLQGKMLYLNVGGQRMVGLRHLEAALERVLESLSRVITLKAAAAWGWPSAGWPSRLMAASLRSPARRAREARSRSPCRSRHKATTGSPAGRG